jgi:splicing factor 3A subunit 1
MLREISSDILRLTALFTARSGRRFTSDLAQREASNYQFDFLKPSHSLFGYFNRLVEQYTRVLIPQKPHLANLRRRAGITSGPLTEGERRAAGRREVFTEVKSRVEWERWEQQRRKKASDEAERERIEFEAIDWQDFQVVSSIEFTDQDDLIDLPPPMSLREVENMTIAQKKMAAMIMEGKEVGGAVDGDEALEEAMEVDSDAEETPAAPASKEENADGGERKKAVEIIKGDAGAPMKIRKDYVPKCEWALASPNIIHLTLTPLQPSKSQRFRRPLAVSAYSRSPSTTSRNTSVSNCSTLNGRTSKSKPRQTVLHPVFSLKVCCVSIARCR